MLEAAARQEYERAAELRDLIDQLRGGQPKATPQEKKPRRRRR
jgi:hypothetical protein